jgi:hypothetical protein
MNLPDVFIFDGMGIMLILGVVFTGMFTGILPMIVAYITPPKVVEWRLDPPEGLHHFDGSTEPTETELADIDHQKRIEILYHAVKYNRGKCTTQRHGGLFSIIEEKWNARLEAWPQYKHWKIGFHWMRAAIDLLDYDKSGLPIIVASGNSANIDGGYYVLVSPVPGGGRGSDEYRRLVSLTELVELWRKDATKAITDVTAGKNEPDKAQNHVTDSSNHVTDGSSEAEKAPNDVTDTPEDVTDEPDNEDSEGEEWDYIPEKTPDWDVTKT